MAEVNQLREQLNRLQAQIAAPEVHRIAVKMPPFWRDRPGLWFAQLEAQFGLSRITEEQTKFAYVVANLQENMACEVEDIINSPPADRPYSTLKTSLIERVSHSEQKRVRQLILEEELGDRKPSQFLRHLRFLAGTAVQDSLVKTLWLQRLPVHVQEILQTQAELTVDALAATADKILEVQPSNCHRSVNVDEVNTSLNQRLEAITTQLEQLQKEVSALRKRSRQSHRSRHRSTSSQYRSKSNDNGTPSVCWYHRKFGDKATRCTQPCNYQSKNVNHSS